MSRHSGRRAKGAQSGQAVPAPPSATMPSPPSPPSPPLLPPAPRPPDVPPSMLSSDQGAQGAQGTVSTLLPITTPPPVVPRPMPSLVPHGRGQRKAALRDERRKHVRRGSVIAGAVVALGAIVAGVLVTTGGGAKKPPVVASPDGRTQHTVLLTLAPAGAASVESVLMAHDSANGGQGQFVLVPSDILTEVAGRGSMQLGDAATFGVDVTAQTLSDMISVTVDGSWQLTPDGLAALVDHLGGITVDVPIDIPVGGQVVVSAGSQHLTGAQASALSTYIAADEPSGARLARFETVMVAIMAKLGPDPTVVAKALAALTTGSTLDAAHAQLIAQVLAGLDSDAAAQNVTYTTLPTTVLDTGSTQEQLAVDGTGTAAMVKQSFAGSVPSGRVAGRNRVIVLNGTGQLGLGQSARDRLTAHGLVFVRSANQPGFGYQNKPSVVLIPDATPDSVASGNRVATALGLPTSDVETSTIDTSAADVITILGADYKP
jgi:anionic cell wall polymer biosynthesis LytR-Cps2A-Psr (LCP) family protein